MPGGLSARLAPWTALMVVWGWAGAIGAARPDPVSVDVEGIVPIAADGGPSSPRDTAFERALLEAALAVAHERLMSEQSYELREAALREALAGSASRFVLTYRITGSLERREPIPDPDAEPGAEPVPWDEEWALPVNATVDARALRTYLEQRDLLGGSDALPSLALRVHPDPSLTARGAEGAIASLRQQLVSDLQARELVVVEPALRGTALSGRESGLELARALGADLGIDVEVGWKPERATQAQLVSGVALVHVEARRASDGSALALARFQGAGVHADPDEALLRALEAVREQVVDNLLLQLSRNWDQLARTSGPVEVVLLDVQRLGQVDDVRAALEGALGAERVMISELGPRRASLRVDARFSPGALQDRLSAAVFDGFHLEPVAVSAERVELRIYSEPDTDEADPAGRG